MATMDVDLGESGVVHAIQTPRGVMFSMSEVASTIFHENPSAFAKELRQGRYNKQHIEDKTILETLAHLNFFPDSSTSIGATLLSPRTLEELLNDKRKFDLVPILKVALMRMVTQQSATLMAQGDLENALSLALDAIKQAQQIFYPKAPLQLVPLYLLAVQSRFEDCLAFGDVVVETWLLVMGALVLNEAWFPSKSFGNLDPEITPNLRNCEENIRWVHTDDIVCMLQDILGVREEVLGVTKASGEEIFVAIALIYLYKKDFRLALENLNKARKAISEDTKSAVHDMINSALLLIEGSSS